MRLRIASYNILHCENDILRKKGERVIDPSQTAETVRALDVDICGLNEVYCQCGGDGLCDQSAVMGDVLGMHAVFAEAIDIPHGKYGNALLSRYPILSLRRVPICTLPEEREYKGKFEDRVLLVAQIEVAQVPLTVMVCHFGLESIEQERALEVVRREVARVNTPLIFMGDLNVTPDSRVYGELASFLQDAALSSNAEAEALMTFSRDDPRMKIDYIFTNSLCRAVDFEVVRTGCSDHLPIRATVEFGA